METKKIIIPYGWEFAEVNGNEITLKEKQTELPATWEEFCETHPIKAGEASIGNNSCILEIKDSPTAHTRQAEYDRDLLPDYETAEAVLALCQLI